MTPGEEWQYFAVPLTSRLIRFSYVGDPVWLKKYQSSAYLRLKVGPDDNAASWRRFWPKHGEDELFLLAPILIAYNYLDIRKRRNFESLAANYIITVEEWRADPYLISYPTSPTTMDGDPMTMDGEPVIT